MNTAASLVSPGKARSQPGCVTPAQRSVPGTSSCSPAPSPGRRGVREVRLLPAPPLTGGCLESGGHGRALARKHRLAEGRRAAMGTRQHPAAPLPLLAPPGRQSWPGCGVQGGHPQPHGPAGRREGAVFANCLFCSYGVRTNPHYRLLPGPASPGDNARAKVHRGQRAGGCRGFPRGGPSCRGPVGPPAHHRLPCPTRF